MKIWKMFQRKAIAPKEHKILTCSIHDDVRILGHVFHGLEDICSYVEMSMSDGSSLGPSKREAKKKGDVHVGELWMKYPCFDSSDYMYENRYYQNFIFRKRPISASDIKNLEQLPTHGNSKRLSLSVPEDMLPMAFYNGEGDTFLVLT